MTAEITNADGSRIADQEGALLEGLTSKSALERCYARAVAARMSLPLEAWVDSEFERGTNAATIVTVATTIAIDHVGSIVGYLVPSHHGQQIALDVFKAALDGQFLKVCARSAKAHAEWSASSDDE